MKVMNSLKIKENNHILPVCFVTDCSGELRKPFCEMVGETTKLESL